MDSDLKGTKVVKSKHSDNVSDGVQEFFNLRGIKSFTTVSKTEEQIVQWFNSILQVQQP